MRRQLARNAGAGAYANRQTSMTPPQPGTLLKMFALNAAVFAALALVFFGIEKAWKAAKRARGGAACAPFPGHPVASVRDSLTLAFCTIAWAVGGAIALSAAVLGIADAFGIELPSQDLMQWLKGDDFSPLMKALVVAYAVSEAPLLEELVFRRFIFRALIGPLGMWRAAAASAAIFAAVHLNALSFLPLVFVGGAFAWLYWRTGRLWTAMLAHFGFNTANAALVFLFPELP